MVVDVVLVVVLSISIFSFVISGFFML